MASRASRRGRSGGDGPRARLSQLLPFLLEHRATLIIVAVLSVFGAVTTLAQPLLVSEIIARVQLGEVLGSLVWTIVALVIVTSLISGYQHYLLQRTGTAVVYSSRRRLIGRLLHLPIEQFDARRTGDLVSRVGTDTTLLYAVLTQGLADAVGNLLIFLGALIAMLIIDPALLGLIALVLGASIALVGALSLRIRKATAEQQERVGELASGVERAVSSIRTIRASGATDREISSLNELAGQAYGAGVRIAKVSSLVVPVAGIALQVSLLVVLGVGGFRVAAGDLDIAELVSFIMFLFLLVAPLATFFGAFTSVNEALGALGRIQEIIDTPQESADDAPVATPASPSTDAKTAIRFDEVTFSYPAPVVRARQRARDEAEAILGDAQVTHPEHEGEPQDTRPVLSGVSFSVPRGARVALVGPSGAGKSTILALIERFYDPQSGSIAIDGRDTRELPRDALRALFGYVEQDAPTLAGTLAENLRLATPDASDADCIAALEAVNLGEVLARSPLGLETPVGENGVLLSGGERQRLAIARALLSDRPILLLDESTSSLDGVNERRMRDAIDRASVGRTLLVIAHRLSTVVDSDLIVVLDGGRVIGTGTHDELVETVPLYRSLAEHQLLV